MNLRTITLWVLYVPSRKQIVAARQFKYQVERLHHPEGSVVVETKGHYVRRSSTRSKP